WSYREERPEAHVLVIRAPYPGGTSRGRAMEIHREALREHATHEIEHARLVSAHVGGPTGAAIAPLLRRRTRFTITEHATYVKALFKDVSAAVQYRAAVARAQRVLAVSDGTSIVLRRVCPEQSDLISAVPNPVRFDHLPLREEPMRAPDRWLFVGNLVERKGVDLLVGAFAQEVAATREQEGRDLQLTLVGDGPMRAELESRVAAQGIADRVHFIGQVPPSQVTGYFRTHDVLVHLSDYETFGITLVEAAAAGLPVVVTRCGGPQETMVIPAGFGTCVFVAVRPELSEVREAVNALRTDVTHDELRAVRDLLRSFYGFERVADLLQKYVFGSATPTPLADPLDLAIVVALQGPAQWQRARHGCDRAADMGARVTVVDLEGLVRLTPAGVVNVTPGDADRYNALRYVERAVVDRGPRAALRAAERLVPRLPNRYGRVALGTLLQASRTQRRVANFSDRQVYRRVWGVVRGQSMARRVQRQPELEDLGRIDVIVHMGGRLTQLAYRLWSKNREAVVHNGSFSAATVASWWLQTHHRPHPRQLQERS
ncbi:MAG: glycosyltransferase, partial [Micrococcales bacterium]|nr:glycosyltransferase [Micrococcales bacterium]